MSPRDADMESDMARAIGLGALGTFGRLLFALLILVASLAWLAGVSCSSSRGDAADAQIEAAGQRQVAAALAQHRQTLKALAAVKDAAAARVISDRAVQTADSARAHATVVDGTTVAIRSALDDLPTLVTVPVQVTGRMTADSIAIAKLKLTVVGQANAIAELVATLQADSALSRAKDKRIAALEAKKTPRCGKWCNRTVGAAAVVITAAVANTVRNAFTGRRSMQAMSWEAP